ncbi:hypothetical protein ES703_69383 [subsurface metagenome]
MKLFLCSWLAWTWIELRAIKSFLISTMVDSGKAGKGTGKDA